jgi:biopolymer transport protein ExbB
MEVTLGSLSTYLMALRQLPGMEAPERTFAEQVNEIWVGGGWMMWPLLACAVLGLIIIVWKLFDLTTKAGRTRRFLNQVDELIAQRKLKEALALARDSNSPAGRILAAGLERSDEGSERVMKAIENVGLIEMIQAFQAIEAAGEVEATVVAGGIKVALITTAAGLTIAIPINIMHNYFVTRVDRLVIDMEESAQKMIDAVHAVERANA